jgi:hypothetical protein
VTDEQKLSELRSKLWTMEARFNSRLGRNIISYTENRKMTDGEWLELQAILSKQEFLINPTTDEFGFNHAMAVFSFPVVPGVDDPQCLLVVVAGQLPWTNQYGHAPKNAWETFCRFTHTPRQDQYRQFLNMDVPLNKGHYEY